MYTAHKTTKSSYRSRKKKLWVIAGVIALLVLAGVILELTGVTDFINTGRSKHYVTTPAKPNRTINEQTKGETGSDNSSNGDQNSSQPGDDKGETNVDTSTPLTTPTGPFVSNHKPNLSGSPSPSKIQSTCTTTPGATCQIFFKMGSVTKSLPAQQTDRGGSAYWSWALQDIDLTEGDWEITAKATLGNQTQAATDSLKLEVKQ